MAGFEPTRNPLRLDAAFAYLSSRNPCLGAPMKSAKEIHQNQTQTAGRRLSSGSNLICIKYYISRISLNIDVAGISCGKQAKRAWATRAADSEINIQRRGRIERGRRYPFMLKSRTCLRHLVSIAVVWQRNVAVCISNIVPRRESNYQGEAAAYKIEERR